MATDLRASVPRRPRRPQHGPHGAPDPEPAAPGRGGLRIVAAVLQAAWPLAVFAVVIAVVLTPAALGPQAITLPHDILLERPPWDAVEPAEVHNAELSDVINNVYPVQRTLLHRLAAGVRSDLLDDVSLGVPGLPFIAWGGLSPFNLVPAVVPFDLGWDWSMALRLFVAMVGTHLLARSYGLSRAAGTVAGLAFGLSGYMIGWLGWPQTHVGAFVPWVALAARRCALPQAGWPAAPALALATAGLWLGGFPAVAAWGLVAAAVLALHTAATAPAVDVAGGRWPSLRRPLLLVRPLAGVVAGTGLVAFTMLPSLVMAGDFGLGYRAALWAARVPPHGLVTYVVPRAFGDVVSLTPWIGAAYVETIGYVGVTTLVLGLAGLCLRPRRRGTWLALGGAVGFVALAYGAGPLPQVVRVLPLLGEHPPARAVAIAGLFLALLAGFGLEAVLDWLRLRRRVDWPVAAVVAGVVVAGAQVLRALFDRQAELLPADRAGAALAFARSEALTAVLLVAAVVLLIAAARLLHDLLPAGLTALAVIALVAVDLVGFAAPWNTTTPSAQLFPDGPGMAEAAQATADGGRVAGADAYGLPNTHLLYGFSDLRARAFYTTRFRQLADRAGVRWLSATWFDLASNDSGLWQPWLSVLGVEQVLTTSPVEAVGSIVVQPRAESVLPPLTPGVVQRTVVPAPRDGRVTAVQMPVGTYGRRPDGELLAWVFAAGGDSAAGRRPAGSLTDLSWGAVPLDAPVTVRAGEPVTVELAGSAPPEGALSLFGAGETAEPALALVYDDGSSMGLAVSPLAPGSPVQVIDNRSALAPVSAMGTARAVTPGSALEELAALGHERLGEVAVVDRPADGFALPLPRAGSARVTAWRAEPGEITAEVVAGDQGAVVVASQQRLSGWRAYVDDREVPLLTVDHVLLGAQAPPGRSQVRFVYRTPLWDEGRLVSVATVVLLVGGAAGEEVLRRRRRPPDGAPTAARASR